MKNNGLEIYVAGLPSRYEVEHLARVFYPGTPVRATGSTRGALLYCRLGKSRYWIGLRQNQTLALQGGLLPAGASDKQREFFVSRQLYDFLLKQTGQQPPWGMLTGVRPVKLLRSWSGKVGLEAARQYFLDQYRVSPQKLELAQTIMEVQQTVLQQNGEDCFSLYVSIPFCPSRCAYCSFVSRNIDQDARLVEPYLDKLEEELALTAQVARQCGLSLSSVYIGGGTPTALAAPQFERLLQMVERYFDTRGCREYTVEAGRPDCTDLAKLQLIKQYGAGRISINPQTLNDQVLANIGRHHKAQDIVRCFEEARSAGHGNINMDIIAGLPGDTRDSFNRTLQGVLALGPENITVHTLTLKRASNLVLDRLEANSSPTEMVASAGQALADAGYLPYYLYRQKSGVENLENTGWCKPGRESVYNICIMEEAHSILAVGAGASTKVVARKGALLQRIYNHKHPLEYIENFAQIRQRKEGVRELYASHMDS